MSRNKFIERLKINTQKATRGVMLGTATMLSITGCQNNKEISPQTEIQEQNNTEQINAEIENKNKILLEYNQKINDLKNQIRSGKFDELKFENEIIRGIQILTAISNGFEISEENDESQSIIPERDLNGGIIIGYRLPDDLKKILQEGAEGQAEEYAKALSLSKGELNYDAAKIYNEYIADLYKTDNKKVETIEKMEEMIKKQIKQKIKGKSNEGR